LFDPAREHDSCGVGIIADMSNAKRHDIIEKGLQILLNLRHRGAVGADPRAGFENDAELEPWHAVA